MVLAGYVVGDVVEIGRDRDCASGRPAWPEEL
jgi:hypothetical protein